MITEKLMTYAVGRHIDYRDMPAVRSIVRTAAANNYRFEDIVLGVVNSAAFRRRETPCSPACDHGAGGQPFHQRSVRSLKAWR